MAARTTQAVEIEGRRLTLSNLAKPLYPSGFTKGQVIDYYVRAASRLLPHVADRPVTLKRYPNGTEARFFYEKNAPRYTPQWVRTFPVPRRTGGPDIRYIVIDSVPALVWCANMAGLELHPFLHRVPRIGNPTAMVFDLDPDEALGVLGAAEVALLLRDALDRAGLESWAKVSGSKGVQVYVPLNTPATYDQTQAFARGLAESLERQHPKQIVSAMAKDLRRNKVFIDWSQNSDFKTTVAVYSLRAKRSEPFVSMPVEWDELRRALKRKEEARLYFGPEAALKRLDKAGDLFAPVLTVRQKLPRNAALAAPF
jgi:bifunctional non-homologous end joining protein LigD